MDNKPIVSLPAKEYTALGMLDALEGFMSKKPTVSLTQSELDALPWRQHGKGRGAQVVGWGGYILLRESDKSTVLVFNEQEWEAFLLGAKLGEFD